MAHEMKKKCVNCYRTYEVLPDRFTGSPLGLTDKAEGTKRRIHSLSFPADNPTFINGGIPEEYGTIKYSTISAATTAIRNYGKGCLLIKRDFERAFRHIPVSPVDSPLLGFKWVGTFSSERFLPFGLRTATYLVNLFAESFQWILADNLQSSGIVAQILHYLEDFLIIIPPSGNQLHCCSAFAKLTLEVGFSIKEAKNEQ